MGEPRLADHGDAARARRAAGDLLAGGSFESADGNAATDLARWDGVAWSTVSGGANTAIEVLAEIEPGVLAAGGSFSGVGGLASSGFARLVTPCRAAAAPIATACIGPAGPIALAAESLPWTGSAFRSTATGFAAPAIGVSLLGFASPALPLANVNPHALPGCDLLASGDAILLHVPAAGRATYSLALPDDVAFAGLPLLHQFLQFALDPTGNVSSLSSSNVLALVVGRF